MCGSERNKIGVQGLSLEYFEHGRYSHSRKNEEIRSKRKKGSGPIRLTIELRVMTLFSINLYLFRTVSRLSSQG